MLIKAVDGMSGKGVAQISVDGIMPSPNAGDIFVDLDDHQYRVLQRAYILQKESPRDLILGGPMRVDVELQLAVCPVGKEAEYAAQE